MGITNDLTNCLMTEMVVVEEQRGFIVQNLVHNFYGPRALSHTGEVTLHEPVEPAASARNIRKIRTILNMVTVTRSGT